MCVKKLICLVSFVLMLSLVGNVQAQDVITWTGAIDSDWFNPDNWNLRKIPELGDTVRFRYDDPGAVIDAPGAECTRLDVGSNGDNGNLTIVDGGILDVVGGNNDINLGRGGGGSKGTLNVFGGTITISRDLDISDQADSEGVVNMTGGMINIGDDLELPNIAGNTGTLHMTGGTINITDNFDMLEPGAVEVHLNGGTIIVGGDLQLDDAEEFDIGGGTLIVNGNAVATVQGFIDNGYIIAYDGDGTVQLDYDVTNQGKTTLKGVHKLKPNPADGGIVAPGVLELSWTLPDPCVPGQPVSVDVYFTDDFTALQWFTDPAAMQVVNKQNVTSVVVQTQPKTRYYWAVDTYVGDPNDPIFGPIFSFVADNSPPEVDAGANIVTWLQDGSRTGNLDATVTDDDAYTVQWTVVSEPGAGAAVIETATAEDTSVTLAAVGEYVLQLEASDGEYTGSDTVTINVYNDSCEAAQSLPDYVPLVGDLNGDCKVDDADMALLQENWLKDNSLTEGWFKVN